MDAKQLLKEYISKHPDYWEYENEMREVQRLKDLCIEESEASLALEKA